MSQNKAGGLWCKSLFYAKFLATFWIGRPNGLNIHKSAPMLIYEKAEIFKTD